MLGAWLLEGGVEDVGTSGLLCRLCGLCSHRLTRSCTRYWERRQVTSRVSAHGSLQSITGLRGSGPRPHIVQWPQLLRTGQASPFTSA